MFNYFKEELYNLRVLAKEFAKKHPAAAPMLSTESTDPDVERLLEGVAFLVALLKKKLDDDFPELIYNFTELIFPQLLRPMPGATIVRFRPKPGLKEKASVKKGTYLNSKPYDDSIITFQTSWDLDVYPVYVDGVKVIKKPGSKQQVVISLKSEGVDFSSLDINHLDFFISGSFSEASDIFYWIYHKTERVILKPEGADKIIEMNADNLQALGFDNDHFVFPYPENSFSGFGFLQEYFIMPYKFLHLRLNGLSRLKEASEFYSLDVIFELSDNSDPPEVTEDNIMLFTTAAVNLFEHDATPIQLDHTKEKIKVLPEDKNLQIYKILSVSGFSEQTVEKFEYEPYSFYAFDSEDKFYYQETKEISPVTGKLDTYIKIFYPERQELIKKQTLVIKLLCTNGSLVERLRLKDLSQPSVNSPENLTFENVVPTTKNLLPLIDTNSLWQFLDHLSLNLLSLGDSTESLKRLLSFYSFKESNDKRKTAANMKRIEGIEDVSVRSISKIFEGTVYKGLLFDIKANHSNFASFGDLYIFGCVLNEFLSQYVSINSFVKLKIEDVITGEVIEWKERLGKRKLY